MAMQELGPTEAGRRGLDSAETNLRRISAANPVTQDASRAPQAGRDKGDSIEVSLAARALAAGEEPELVARREEHTAAMRNVIESGELASAERIERAARRLLGG
ncbi:MAG: hypothetical protein ACKVXR_12515 [Planctomycetota bacterium]